MKTTISFFILGLGLLLTISCTKYPPSSSRLTEDLAVATQYDVTADFNNYKTYSITDAIMKITDKDTTPMTGPNAAAILAQIDKNMNARGFVKVADPVKPDLGIQVVYFQNTKVTVYSYGGYWGYPYWGYYYPYYPVYYSTYTTGAVDIELIDLKYVNQSDHTLTLRWNAIIRGLLTGNHTTPEITASVDQAFTQTPQLKTTGQK